MAKRSRKKEPVAQVENQSVSPNRDWPWSALLLAAVVIAYSPVWWATYVWDDDTVLTSNPVIVGPLGLLEIWTTRAADICPLTLTIFWFEHKLWGLAPLPYHLVNVLLHGASAIVLWHVLRSLRVPGAWLGAALWALHPVQVESVAWISELKNTGSCLFFLFSILFFVRWLKETGPGEQGSRNWNYTYTLLFAALALTAKSSTVVLPIILGLCAWWVEGKLPWRTTLGILPLLLMSIAAGIVTIWTQGLNGASDPQWARSWPGRFAVAGDIPWFYLGKLLWPDPLITVYPRWQIDAGQWYAYLPLLALIAIAVILWLKRNTWSRPWFFAFALFVVALLPVLGFFNTTYFALSFVADHFQYLASMAPLALAGAGLVRLSGFLPGKAQTSSTLGTILLLVLGLLSWQRAWIYENEETLWLDALPKNPDCWIGHNNYGNFLVKSGQIDEGIAHLQRALDLNPGFRDGQISMAAALLSKGRLDEAISHCQKAIEISPNSADAYYNFGVALYQQGHLPEAIDRLKKAIDLDPTFALAQYDLGVALGQQGHATEAIARFRKAIALDPGIPEAHNNLGISLAKQGQIDDAIAEFKEALRLKPGYPDAQNNLATALATQHQNTGQK